MCCQSWADAINSHYTALKIEPNLTWTGPQTIDKLPVDNGNVWSPISPPASCCSVILQTQCYGSVGRGHSARMYIARRCLLTPQSYSFSVCPWSGTGEKHHYHVLAGVWKWQVLFAHCDYFFFFFSLRATGKQRQWAGESALGKTRAKWF